MLMIIILIFTNNVKSYRSEYSDESSEENIKRLARVFNEFLTENSDDEYSFEKRGKLYIYLMIKYEKYYLAEAMKKVKCTEIRKDGYFKGTPSSNVEKIPSARTCKQICDASETCMGWSHSSSTETCSLQTTVEDWITDRNFKGGSCAGKF